MQPTFFATQEAFRSWLERNHDREPELVVGFWKVGSGKPSMTWSESVDQALCFGWIDGVRRRIDDDSYSIRFSPRRPNSIWSKINIAKVEELTKLGLMTPTGLAAFAKKTDAKSAIYAYEKEPREFSGEYLKLFQKDIQAWEFFRSQAPSYRRVITQWVYGAKQESTRLRRLDKLITASAAKERIV